MRIMPAKLLYRSFIGNKLYNEKRVDLLCFDDIIFDYGPLISNKQKKIKKIKK